MSRPSALRSENFAVSSTVDTCVLIYDAAGTTRLAWNDNQRGSHSDAGVTLQPGTYTVLVMGKTGTVAGDYGLDVFAYPAAVVNTDMVESPSPLCFNSTPPAEATAVATNSSWRASASAIACGERSHNPVEPSMSVSRNVTVPDGTHQILTLIEGRELTGVPAYRA